MRAGLTGNEEPSGGRAMTVLSDFSADERRLLLSSLEAAGIAVSAASPGRREETASEAFAVASFVLDSRAAYVADPLVSSVILELEARARAHQSFPDYSKMAAEDGAEQRALGILRDVVVLLDTRATPDESAAYRGWLMRVARAAAEAGKEDQGFLGRGGVMINDAERAALGRIGEIVRVEP